MSLVDHLIRRAKRYLEAGYPIPVDVQGALLRNGISVSQLENEKEND